ncbi:MAG TPA: CamS family sex pheromone protein [Bacillales bacterium]
MYRRMTIIVCVFLLFLSGCTPGFNKENETKKIVKETEEKGKQAKQVKITPRVETTEEYYRTVVDFEPGAARGHILYGVGNRLDIDELETGLMDISKSAFPPDQYIYRDGQYLGQDTLESWLENKDMNKYKTQNGKVKPYNPLGLNPELPKNYHDFSWEKKKQFLENHPSYLSYVVEQNYLVKAGDDKLKLGGISIAISMSRIFTYEIEDDKGLIHSGEVMLDNQEKIKEKARQFAGMILKRIRKMEELKEVPIVIGLYQEETSESVVPGHYFAKTVVDAGDHSIGDWKAIQESHVLFPSDEADRNHKADADRFEKFKDDIQKYFPNFVGVIGKAYYKNHELQHLRIEIPIKFYAQTEVISFTQYVTGLVSKSHNPFPKEVPLEVYISSTAGPEALIIRKPNMDEPFVHIFR